MDAKGELVWLYVPHISNVITSLLLYVDYSYFHCMHLTFQVLIEWKFPRHQAVQPARNMILWFDIILDCIESINENLFGDFPCLLFEPKQVNDSHRAVLVMDFRSYLVHPDTGSHEWRTIPGS